MKEKCMNKLLFIYNMTPLGEGGGVNFRHTQKFDHYGRDNDYL